MISSLYVASSLSVLVVAVYQSDGLEIEADQTDLSSTELLGYPLLSVDWVILYSV